jgi:putative intracellular protease/amidase
LPPTSIASWSEALLQGRITIRPGLHLSGRRHQPDKLRIIPEAVAFAKAFFGTGKPVAAICHDSGR